MKTKDQVIHEIMGKLQADTIPRDIENRLRNAYNEGFKAGHEYGKEDGIGIGADLAAMHGSDATSKDLEESYWKGVEVGADKIWDLAKKIWFSAESVRGRNWNQAVGRVCRGVLEDACQDSVLDTGFQEKP